MKILSVRINNILSIENAYIEFDDKGLMLVQGWNYDDGRANGAGKTAIFNAITFALYDQLPRKITATEILRRGARSGFVEVRVQVGSIQYMVRRSRPKGVTHFVDNGSGYAPIVITQIEWESKLKLNYKQYIIAAYCAQGTTSRFLSINDSDKKQFLLQLLNLEEFSSCKIGADAKVKALELELIVLKSRIGSIDSKIEAYSESLVSLDEIVDQKEQCEKIIASTMFQITANQKVNKPDLSKYQKIEDDITTKKTEITKTKMRREMLHDQYKKVNIKIKPFNAADSCHYCGTSLDNTGAHEVHDKEVELFKQELSSLKSQIDECDTALLKEKTINEFSTKLKDKKKDESKEYEVASLKISELQSRLSLKQQEVKNLNLKLSNNSDLQSKINMLQVTKTELVKSQANVIRNIELYKTVSAMYSPTGAQAYILDSVIESFNERVQEYVNILWNNMTYELKSYKENVSGDVSARFSENLIINSKPISIGSLSGGEFRALSLCVDFALVDVMERQFGIFISPIILDEPFDGLDASGRELIVELLEKISDDRQIIVVDHSSEIKSMFSKVVMVEKRSSVSTISML